MIPNGVQAMAKSTYTVNGYVLGNLLEDGTSKMAPRPMHDKVIEESKSEVSEIFLQSISVRRHAYARKRNLYLPA